MARIEYPTYYQEIIEQAYPFDPKTSRSNGQVSISNEIFIDGRIYLPKTPEFVYLSSIEIQSEIRIVLADETGEISDSKLPRFSDNTEAHFFNENGIYHGLLQFSLKGLKLLSGWPEGLYKFNVDQTKLTPSIVIPQPQKVVRGIRLESGELFFGDICLVGEKGVQLTVRNIRSSSSGSAIPENFIRVDIVGDPLFERRKCLENGLDGPNDKFIRFIDFRGQKIAPDQFGSILFLLKSQFNFSPTPAVRITPTEFGLKISFVKNG